MFGCIWLLFDNFLASLLGSTVLPLTMSVSLMGPSSLDFSLILFPHITQRMCTYVVKKIKTKQNSFTLVFPEERLFSLTETLSRTLSSESF